MAAGLVPACRHADFADGALGLGPASSDAASEEFLGPFPSWLDVRRDFGARGDGQTDDTPALQAALDALGVDGRTVMFLPAGTYRITTPLRLANREGISVVGEDPLATRIAWDGPSGADMFDVYGVAYLKVSRLTWDGAGRAGTIVYHWWDQQRGDHYFPTHSEYSDSIFQSADFCLRAGKGRGGVAETVVKRVRFLGCQRAGVSMQDWNALDWFVWDSHFQNSGYGVTNLFSDVPGTIGAGQAHVYRSSFVGSRDSDIGLGNTLVYSVRGNTSVDSRAFVRLVGPTGAPINLTIEGNLVTGTLDVPILTQVPGPVVVVGNRFVGTPSPNVVTGSNGEFGYLVSVGNRFSGVPAQRLQVHAGSVTTAFEARNTVEPAPPDWRHPSPRPVPFPRRSGRPVFEVPAAADGVAIQQAIDRAAKVDGIVHLPAGSYAIRETLRIPGGARVDLVGDGIVGSSNGTQLVWRGAPRRALMTAGDVDRLQLRDLTLNGENVAGDLLHVAGLDRRPTSIRLEQVDVREMGAAIDGGLRVEGIASNVVRAKALYHSDNAATSVVVDGAGRGALLEILGGASSNNRNSYAVIGGGSLLVQDVWYESAEPRFVRLDGTGSFSIQGSHISPSSATASGSRDVAAVDAAALAGDLFMLNNEVRGFVTLGSRGGSWHGIVANTIRSDVVDPVSGRGPSASPVLQNNFVPTRSLQAGQFDGSADALRVVEQLLRSMGRWNEESSIGAEAEASVGLYRVGVMRGLSGIRLSQ